MGIRFENPRNNPEHKEFIAGKYDRYRKLEEAARLQGYFNLIPIISGLNGLSRLSKGDIIALYGNNSHFTLILDHQDTPLLRAYQTVARHLHDAHIPYDTATEKEIADYVSSFNRLPPLQITKTNSK